MSKVTFHDVVLDTDRILCIRFNKVEGIAKVIFDTGYELLVEGQAALSLAASYEIDFSGTTAATSEETT
ncbi:MAG: hypothetical protein WBV94_04420 [Blastocatellia bacterium]